jgi:ArsR family transcriptional regulator
MAANRHRDFRTRSIEAIAHPARLAIVEVVVATSRDGIASGEIARRVGLSAAGTSHHLSWLADAGLLLAQRSGRSVVYRADAQAIETLLDELRVALTEDGAPASTSYGRGIGVGAVPEWTSLPPGRMPHAPALPSFDYDADRWRGACSPPYRKVKVEATVTMGPARTERRRMR